LDFTPLLAQLRVRTGQIAAALAGAPNGTSLVLCAGNRALLTGWLNIPLQAADPGAITVVGAATTAAEALQLVEQHRPTLLLSTDRLEQGDGATLVERVKGHHPATRTLLVVSDACPRQSIRRASRAGCDGLCLESRVGLGTILAAVQSICAGGIYLDRELAAVVRQPAGLDAAEAIPQLSAREVEVLDRLQRGLSNQEIGKELFVSADTVKTHVSHLLQKLGARDRGHAAVIGLRLGLIDWQDR